MVSIPILVTWTKILGNSTLSRSDMVASVIEDLLGLCSTRLIRYENLPEESDSPQYLFLMEDTDTIPERHAFLGNYRRYSSIIIEHITQLRLHAAITYILGRTEMILQHLYDGEPGFNSKINSIVARCCLLTSLQSNPTPSIPNPH